MLWVPLTWSSYLLDSQLFGLKPGGYHFTNILLHAATAILLFLILRRMTGSFWPSAFVAAVFAIHPQHVESVAWVAERKGVLSGLFFMLALWAYVGYVRHRFSLARYALVIVLFALGLMAKPMLVTLPFVLLLLDYWPLGRMGTKPRQPVAPSGVMDGLGSSEVAAGGRGFGGNVWFLVLEKIPLFVVAGGDCLMTFRFCAQEGSLVSIEQLPLWWRMGSVMIAYVTYLGQFFRPVGLNVLYTRSGVDLSLWKVLVAFLILASVTMAAFIGRRRHPYILVGWLWYLGMLVSVIGFLQVGVQASADRFTYLPQIGPCIVLAWGVANLSRFWPYYRPMCGAGSALVLAILMACAWRQTTFWRDSETLWTRTLACTSPNYRAHFNYGVFLFDHGRVDEAIVQYQQALAVLPNDFDAHTNLGVSLFDRGRVDEATVHYRRAIEIQPRTATARYNLGLVLASQGRTAEAIENYREALKIKPNFGRAHANLGVSLLDCGRIDEAMTECRKALEIDPGNADAHTNLGNALLVRGQLDEAITEYRQALEIKPDHVKAHNNLGYALAGEGRFDEAVEDYRKALEIEPNFPQASRNLNDALSKRKRILKMLAQQRELLRLHPDDAILLNDTAWVLATNPNASVRDGAEAIELAQRAVGLSGGRQPAILGTLAAAYAEARRFPEALQAAHKALDLATRQNQRPLSESIKAKIRLYESGTPYREPSLSPSTSTTQP
jgi:tetratricopeptide (TPR) repeat protein